MKFRSAISLVVFIIAVRLSAQTNIAKQYEDVSLKKEVVIKKIMSKSVESLVEPTQICVDSKENIFLLESKEKCVKKYAKNGKFLSKFGRGGNGPGEMQECFLMKMDNADNIFLYDEGRKKIIKYSNNGKYLNELSLSFPIDDFYIASEGAVYLESTKEDASSDKNEKLTILSVYFKDMKKQKKIDSCRVKDYKLLTNPKIGIELPFAVKILWGVSKNTVYVAFTGQYKTVLYTKDGKYIKYFNGQAKQVRVTEKDKEDFFKSLNYNSGNEQSRLNEIPVWLKKGTEFPLFKPIISDLLLEPDRNIMFKTAESADNKNIWDVYKTDGTFIKKILAPSTIRDRRSFLRNGYVYAIIESSDGLISVEKYPVNN
jgi:hypothetical protein